MTKIQSTTDYNLFKRIEGNRQPSKAQISKLKLSFDAKPHLLKATPIIVNDKMEVIDGQHRLAAAKELGIPIYYVQVDGLGLPEIQILNSSTKTWSPIDYAQSFAEKGKHDYQTYLDFKRTYHLTHEILVAFLALQEGATPNVFRSGKFKVENEPISHVISTQYLDMLQFHKKGDSKKFAFAFKALALHPIYDHEKFVAKSKAHGEKFFSEAATTEDYMRQLEALWNYHNKDNRIKIF